MSIVNYSSKLLGSISYDDTMFKICKNGFLRYIGPDNIKPIQPIGLKDYSFMFSNREDLTSIDLSDWDMSNVEDISCMFFNCTSLIDVSSLKEWNVSNVKYMNSMFSCCTSLEDISSLKDWNVSNVKDMSDMFQGCTSLKDRDISNVCNIDCMFNKYNIKGEIKMKRLEEYEGVFKNVYRDTRIKRNIPYRFTMNNNSDENNIGEENIDKNNFKNLEVGDIVLINYMYNNKYNLYEYYSFYKTNNEYINSILIVKIVEIIDFDNIVVTNISSKNTEFKDDLFIISFFDISENYNFNNNVLKIIDNNDRLINILRNNFRSKIIISLYIKGKSMNFETFSLELSSTNDIIFNFDNKSNIYTSKELLRFITKDTNISIIFDNKQYNINCACVKINNIIQGKTITLICDSI